MKLLISLMIIFQSSQSFLCEICHHITGCIQHEMPLEPELSILKKISVEYCVKKHMYIRHVCKGAVDEMTPFIINSVWRHYSDPHLVCSELKFCKQ